MVQLKLKKGNIMSSLTNAILSLTNGRFFTVVYTKKDGTIRKMNCRTGVKRYVKGVDVTSGHVSKRDDMLVVYDVKSNGYRTINRDTIIAIRYGKAEVAVL
jgi:hypothetical protein